MVFSRRINTTISKHVKCYIKGQLLCHACNNHFTGDVFNVGLILFLFFIMQTTQSPQQPLAVVGMACRLPGNSNSPTALWRFLEQGGIASTEPPSSRFNLHGHEDGTKRIRTMRSPGGMFLENIDPADIDAQFFGLSRAEATAMDPQQRQLLEVVYEGLENAGITLESLRNQPVGCFVGSYASGKHWFPETSPTWGIITLVIT